MHSYFIHQVIPEVDVPGHSTAAIQAMKLRQEQGGGGLCSC